MSKEAEFAGVSVLIPYGFSLFFLAASSFGLTSMLVVSFRVKFTFVERSDTVSSVMKNFLASGLVWWVFVFHLATILNFEV